MPHKARVVVAGAGFAALREHLGRVLPEVAIEAIEPDVLRRDGTEASVLIPAMARIDGQIMDRIIGLRLIQQWGAGLEGVDLSAAAERRIAVANVPSAGTGNAESVAEWCVMAAIALSRQLPELEKNIRQGGAWGGPIGRGLRGRTAGILGLGGIGQALAARLKPFGMRLAALKRHADPALAERLGLEWVGGEEDLKAFLERSEYLFLCLPLNPRTRNMIGESEIALLPPGACIINPARGGLIGEDALVKALSNGHLSGAALDVFADEPLDPQSRLLTVPGLIATPHIAGVTDVSYRDIARHVAENITRLWSGSPLENRVI
ncbi:MAG: NAD(P)-dependent oxidoreductase [Bryobacteraceae bacterium]|jgi:phosphoglycerate dehydrogenase-like enzyme